MMGKGSENGFRISFSEEFLKLEYIITFLGWLEEAQLRVGSSGSLKTSLTPWRL